MPNCCQTLHEAVVLVLRQRLSVPWPELGLSNLCQLVPVGAGSLLGIYSRLHGLLHLLHAALQVSKCACAPGAKRV